jgi:hypothetical protein
MTKFITPHMLFEIRRFNNASYIWLTERPFVLGVFFL